MSICAALTTTVSLYSNVQTAGDVLSAGAFMPTLRSMCALQQATEPAVHHFHYTWSRASCLVECQVPQGHGTRRSLLFNEQEVIVAPIKPVMFFLKSSNI